MTCLRIRAAEEYTVRLYMCPRPGLRRGMQPFTLTSAVRARLAGRTQEPLLPGAWREDNVGERMRMTGGPQERGEHG